MSLGLFGKVGRVSVFGAVLLGAVSCIEINEHLGENLIPDDQKWDVFVPDPIEFRTGDIVLKPTDSLSAYSSRRFTFGSISDENGISRKSTSFTIIPIDNEIDLGENTRIRKFFFNAVRDTVSIARESDRNILQNVYVYELKKQLDSTILYTSDLTSRKTLEEYVNLDERITSGIPIYDGGDSLSFEFNTRFAERFVEKVKNAKKDTLAHFVETVPGIYITCDDPVSKGGRINMFDIALESDSYGYVTGNYAELKITADYKKEDGTVRKDVDTTFVFLFGPSSFVDSSSSSLPSQYAFNNSENYHPDTPDAPDGKSYIPTDKMIIEGGSGLKPVIKASAVRELMEEAIRKELGNENMTDFNNVVINKATVFLPYDAANLEGGYDGVELFPPILSPTIRLSSEDGNYISYAGLTDSSIESENQGDINRSLCMYCPDLSHHFQSILKLDNTDSDYQKKLDAKDVWFLIMHEETTTTTNNYDSSYYDNLMYAQYYNMMYGGYGGYGGYGYGGYGYGGYNNYGYGYNNYYNYLMMAQYMSGSSSSSTTTSTELDKDRYYNCILNGPEAAIGEHPVLKFTFSLPMK
ncbi:MAG: hypothetical protein PUC61_10390 [Bacteroidales bacterium]|nr:hypothetical protein [Bacteroidales bacterium]